jgi:EAL domain-containing protein (putative c-di-GMP-specific phosphodiesterase class I)
VAVRRQPISPWAVYGKVRIRRFCRGVVFYNLVIVATVLAGGESKVPVAVNLPSAVLEKKGFADKVESLFFKFDAPLCLLKIEISEKYPVTDFESTVNNIKALRVLGVTFSLDDFGVGQNSFYYLKRLPVQEVKIDRIFLEDLDFGEPLSLLKHFACFINNLGMRVVIEGVETGFQKNLLREVSYYALQGYYFSRPDSLLHVKKIAS